MNSNRAVRDRWRKSGQRDLFCISAQIRQVFTGSFLLCLGFLSSPYFYHQLQYVSYPPNFVLEPEEVVWREIEITTNLLALD